MRTYHVIVYEYDTRYAPLTLEEALGWYDQHTSTPDVTGARLALTALIKHKPGGQAVAVIEDHRGPGEAT